MTSKLKVHRSWRKGPIEAFEWRWITRHHLSATCAIPDFAILKSQTLGAFTIVLN